ncbi:UDP-N-acetylmuramoyl-L-alanine--D-glutamate ligase [Candidatus Saccharibacteria bacterium]|nr:UDP-N-acetylmuramoyl-L-alanine--D-glutamate ligase [Candidatus Saccharibacteria bacterium]
MKIAILGYGLEGKSVEKYFKNKAEITIFDNFTELPDTNGFDLVFRTPSVKLPEKVPKNWTSVTRYFFDHCPCEIIGVTGTKGKGTTCTMTTELLKSLGKNVYLVGNIGEPSIDHLDKLSKDDVVVYELSSFQLWDLKKSPSVAIVLRIEPDHLNVHKDFDDYVSAKANIARHQSENDTLIYFKNNPDSKRIADTSPAKKYPYPISDKSEVLVKLLNSLPLVGEHNKENLEAALLATYSYFKTPLSLDEFLTKNYDALKSAIEKITPLPHHIEFVRKLGNVAYYDDSFCTVFPALDVALKSFGDTPLVLIAGGSSKGTDLTPAKKAIFGRKNLIKAVLIGKIAKELAKGEDSEKYILADTDFEKAVKTAKELAENTGKKAIVLLSPCAASFDMFKSYKDRGDQFKNLVNSLDE